jgi:putative flippase GtrA
VKPAGSRARRELTRFYKFLIVGTIGAVVDFGSFNVMNGLLGVWSVLASVLSFIAAVSSNFIWNRFWTYPDSRSKSIRSQAIQFALVNVVGLVIRTPIFALSEKPAERLIRVIMADGTSYLARTPLGAIEPAVLGRNLALAIAVLVVLLWNFGINRIWTYSDVD